jgi:hypothetical protein
MRSVTQTAVDSYCRNDIVLTWLDRDSSVLDEDMTCQRWLRQTPAKRMVFQALYGDLLSLGTVRRRVLDIGGGLTAISGTLARTHDYTLVDLMAHEDPQSAARLTAMAGREFIQKCDWYDWKGTKESDIVLANDLFPNVDQRLELFLDGMIPRCGEIRLSLTYYNAPRFYLTRRTDAEEILCMLAWNGKMTRDVLVKYADRIDDLDLDILLTNESSTYENGRQVCILRMRGELAGQSNLETQ